MQILHINGIEYEITPPAAGVSQADSDFRKGMSAGHPFHVDVNVPEGRSRRMMVYPDNVFTWMIYSRVERQPPIAHAAVTR